LRQILTSFLLWMDRQSSTPVVGHSFCPSSRTPPVCTRSVRLALGWRSFSTPIGRPPRSNSANITTPAALARPSPELVSCEADRTCKPDWTRPARCSAAQDLAPKWFSSLLTSFGAAQLSQRRQPTSLTVASFWLASGCKELVDSRWTAPPFSRCSRTGRYLPTATAVWASLSCKLSRWPALDNKFRVSTQIRIKL